MRKIKDLVARLAARRTPLDDAQKIATEFVTGSAATTSRRPAKLLFAGLFDTLNRLRTEVIDGIERYTRRQREFAERIRADDAEAARAAGHARSGSEAGRASCRSSSSGRRASSRTAGAPSASSARCRC